MIKLNRLIDGGSKLINDSLGKFINPRQYDIYTFIIKVMYFLHN